MEGIEVCVLETRWKKHFKERGVIPVSSVVDSSSKMRTENGLLDQQWELIGDPYRQF